MPIYEFKCPKCASTKEKHFDFKEEHKLLCEKDNALMDKVFHAIPAVFNGTGWGGQ